jgi:hypothetical protein
MNYMHFLLLFCIGTIAGFVNVNAGGGSTLTLPALIFMGLDGALANGTNRIAILLQNIFAVESFRSRKMHDFKLSSHLSIFTLPGAIAGSLLAVRIDSALFRQLLGVVLIFIVISMIFSRPYKTGTTGLSNRSRLIYPAMIGIGFYGGFLQVGVGYLLMAALYHLLKLDLVRVNMHKVFIVLIYTLPALFIFMYTGNVNWKYGLVLTAGNASGGWWGARVAVRGGERAIRAVLAIAIVIMVLKLFEVY